MAHNFFDPNVTTDIKAQDVAQIPYKEGQFLMTSDTNSIYYDFADSRKRLTDIIELETEAQRQAILAPISKFYFVKDTGVLWRYNNGSWVQCSDGGRLEAHNKSSDAHADIREKLSSKSNKSTAVSATLLASGWSNDGRQTLTIAGLGAAQNGIIGLAQSITDEQFAVASEAELYICGQSAASVTIAVNGTTPTCDIPIVVILLG